jgi:hypothetical protein
MSWEFQLSRADR